MNEILLMSIMLEEQLKAELAGQQEFICPICKGKAKWARAESNHHLWIQCHGCGFKLMT